MGQRIRFVPLFSGSKGNAAYVECGETRLLIDAGLAARSIEDALMGCGVDAADLDALLITHEHTDHIRGAGVLSRKYDLPIYANEGTWEAMYAKLGGVALKNTCVFEGGFYLKSLDITSFAIPHDAASPCGYRISSGGHSVALATDMGHCPKEVLSAITGCDVVLLESNHDLDMLKNSRYPASLRARIGGKRGHLSNDAAAKAAVELAGSGVKALILGHLSEENNEERLAYQTVRAELVRAGAGDVPLAIASARRRCADFFI